MKAQFRFFNTYLCLLNVEFQKFLCSCFARFLMSKSRFSTGFAQKIIENYIITHAISKGVVFIALSR